MPSLRDSFRESVQHAGDHKTRLVDRVCKATYGPAKSGYCHFVLLGSASGLKGCLIVTVGERL